MSVFGVEVLTNYQKKGFSETRHTSVIHTHIPSLLLHFTDVENDNSAITETQTDVWQRFLIRSVLLTEERGLMSASSRAPCVVK